MIVAVGVGPGDLGYLTRRGADLIAQANAVIGFETVVNIVRPLVPPTADVVLLTYKNQVERLADAADLHRAGRSCVVVFMGDVHFSGFQLLERVEQACKEPVSTVPGISSAQILASRTRVAFDDTTFVTFHRRGDLAPFRRHLQHVLADGRNAIVIPRPWDYMPKQITAELLAAGVSPRHRVEVWEHLTATEAAWRGSIDTCTSDFSDMSIMLIRSLPDV